KISSKIIPDVETCEAECLVHHGKGFFGKLKDMLSYAYIDLIDDVGKWLVLGILVGGFISYFLPATIIENYFSNPFISYTVMLLIGGSMYVCATGSIPIAASLILKGMNPGAGLVFLIAGPATNAATISFVGGKLGGKTLFIYLMSIIIGSVGFGLLMDSFWPGLGHSIRSAADTMNMLPYWLEILSAVVLVVFISRSYIVKIVNLFYKASLAEVNMKIKVTDMTCEHCKRTIEKVISEVSGVQRVIVNIKTKTVEIQGNPDEEEIFRRIKNAGYTPE
ncbi:MAG: permease, partial [Proteobacteria bacterium]|nr:permease [Pseudomonadota bacterium]